MMIGKVLAKKNKYTCLLISPLFHAYQYEIINHLCIYLYSTRSHFIKTYL